MSKRFRLNVSDSSSSDSAAVPSSSAKRTRQSSPAKRSKHGTAEAGETATEPIEPRQAGCAESQAEEALSSLPPELLAIIIRKLDTTSISNLHNTCRHLRNVVHMPGVVKKLDLSLSTLATVKTKLDIFQDILGHVRVLNLSGVYDLDLPALVHALEHMESLVDLDVSYTNITMRDFLQFSKVRPTLQSLAINFDLGDRLRVRDENVLDYQQAFEGFRTVHFVYPGTFVYRQEKAAMLMLRKADLLTFTLTVVCGDKSDLAEYVEETIDWNITGAMSVSQFQMHLLQDKIINVQETGSLPLVRFMEVEKCEIIIFAQSVCYDTQVLATPLVKRIICDRFAAEVGNLPESTPFSLLNTKLEKAFGSRSEMFVMLWHRERNQFEGEFRSQLSSIFKEYYVFSVNDTLTQIPPRFKLYKIAHVISSAPSSVELDYGEAFKEKREIKLDLQVNKDYEHSELTYRSPRVINNYDFLKKITFLSLTLSGYINYDSHFFNDLFEHCESLLTIQIGISTTFNPISLKSIKKSKLKNIYVEGEESDLLPTFSVLSECGTLERLVYLVKYGYIHTLPDPEKMISKCGNLYYICSRRYGTKR